MAAGFGLENDTKRAANEVMTFFFFFWRSPRRSKYGKSTYNALPLQQTD